MDTELKVKVLKRIACIITMYNYNDFDTVKFQFDFTGTSGR